MTKRSRSKPLQNIEQAKPTNRRRVAILLAALLALGCLFAYQGGPLKLVDQRANNLVNRWKIEEAQWWIQLGDHFSERPDSAFLKARIARLRGDAETFRECLLKAHKLGADPKQLDREQDIYLLSIGEFDVALEAKLAKWIDDNPEDLCQLVDAYVNGLCAQSRITEAAVVLEAYTKLHPEDPMYDYRLGLMNEHYRGNTLAEEHYTNALRKDPEYLKAAWALARIKSGKNLPQDAIKLLEPFDKGQAKLAVQTMIAHCYQQQGDLETSCEMLLKVTEQGFEKGLQSYRAVEEVPERFLSASELGLIYTKLGEWEKAKEYLELALKTNPRDFISRNSYAQVLRRIGDKEASEKELARIVEERKEYDKITLYRDQINQNASNIQARVEMGKILFKYESERYGLFWIRSALQYDPHCQEAHQFLVDYYTQKKQQTTSSGESELLESKRQYHLSQLQNSPPKSSPSESTGNAESSNVPSQTEANKG